MERARRDETPEGGPSDVLRSVATLAAAASHEINNPLMVIVANLELLERTQTLHADGRARLGAALAAAGQIKERVRRLGHITRLELAAGVPNLPPMLDLEKSSRMATGAR
jgi:signal transduction histidine kinase